MADYKIQELTLEQKGAIKASIPYLESAGEVVTATFYKKMLENNPLVRPFFNKAHQATKQQPKILAFALLAYAKNIDDLTPLTAFVNQIVVKHTGLQVKPEHYPVVGENLLLTLADLLGPTVATPFFLESWKVAYGNLAKILIDAEAAIYKQNQWDDFKPFEVVDKVKESSDVVSLYLKPVDGKIQLPKHGQYIGIRFKVDDEEATREYTLSEYPKNNQYRISVKLVERGVVSNYVHETLKVGQTVKVLAPNGQFIYQDEPKNIVALAGGIGITPLVSIIEKALADGKNVELYYSNTSKPQVPFASWLDELKSKFSNQFVLKEFISKTDSEATGDSYRRISKNDLPVNLKESQIYLLGPQSYMDSVSGWLKELGITNYATEFFGVYQP